MVDRRIVRATDGMHTEYGAVPERFDDYIALRILQRGCGIETERCDAGFEIQFKPGQKLRDAS